MEAQQSYVQWWILDKTAHADTACEQRDSSVSKSVATADCNSNLDEEGQDSSNSGHSHDSFENLSTGTSDSEHSSQQAFGSHTYDENDSGRDIDSSVHTSDTLTSGVDAELIKKVSPSSRSSSLSHASTTSVSSSSSSSSSFTPFDIEQLLDLLPHPPTRTFDNGFHSSITISDDQSVLDKVEERQVLALKDRQARQTGVLPPLFPPPSLPPPPPPILFPPPPLPLSLPTHPSSTLRPPLPGVGPPLPPGTSLPGFGEFFEPSTIISTGVSNKFIAQAKGVATFASTMEKDSIQMLGTSKVLPETNSSKPRGFSFPARKRNVSEINSHAELSPNVMDLDAEELQGFIERLEERARQLKATHTNSQVSCRYQVLYRVSEFVLEDVKSVKIRQRTVSPPHFDPPQWVSGQRQDGTFRCNIPVNNFDLFLEQNKDISFIVYRTYQVSNNGATSGGSTGADSRDNNEPEIRDSVQPIAEGLITAIKSLLETQEEYAYLLDGLQRGSELPAPYLFVYQQREKLDTIKRTLDESAQEHLSLFWDYVSQNYGEEYAAADAAISRGQITSKHIQYLFKPGDVIIQQKDGEHLGWIAASQPHHLSSSRKSQREAELLTRGTKKPLYNSTESSKRIGAGKVTVHHYNIEAWHWAFDGTFARSNELLNFAIEADSGADVHKPYSDKSRDDSHPIEQPGMAIKDLKVFPLQHASEEVVAKLRRRGRAFWKCRNRAFVSYQENEQDDMQNPTDERYVVDLKTYRSLHKSNIFGTKKKKILTDELGSEAMSNEEPPDDKFELLLPLTIKGYNLRRKKWYDLIAERIEDIKWHKETFQKVVIERKVKDLIQALVSNQLAAEASTDLIEGKGNGLILLLHGSPGTGKTLTAESVAEIAEKPLYRVTCGDVGTKAEEVEKYLESVLHLGKRWGCVVLLDEADVFLEQRSLEDLERNALVSVFLRILEYYEGILILTSNRVGTFDEAFKSRIQLALHYPSLGPYQRLRIWENFIDRLEDINDDTVDIADLRDHLDDLKDNEMNGRQIRNAITTGRQYAKWKKTMLTYEHLNDVIEVSGRFDDYLKKLHGGYTQDQLAQDDGLRLH